MTDAGSPSGDMDTASGGQKRGPPSPEAHSAKQPKTTKSGEFNELNDLLGWLEQTVM